MEWNIIKSSDYKLNKWSGGQTTELKIFPEESSLDDRNFKYRISSATVEDEESIFSSFKGYRRFISPLEGRMKLDHKNHHSVILNEYDIDEFNGGWETKSRGKCRDFNLILEESMNGYMEIVNGSLSLDGEKIYLYSFEDDLVLEINEKEVINLKRNDMLEVNNKNKDRIVIDFLDNKKENNIILISLNL